MNANQFRFVYTARDFKRTVSFYQETLSMQLIGGWDRPDGKGALLSGGGNAVVEILGAAEGTAYAGPPPSGMYLAIEIDDADGWYQRLVGAGVQIEAPPHDQPWGHRAFRFRDPENVLISLYSVISQNHS
jgi:catechol 2,3-dioxygenase-like lactoylglutathione lyase family enzyme